MNINKKIKVFIIIVIGFVVFVSITLIASLLVLDNKHKAEITRVINEKKGVITEIEKVDSDLSPFKNESNRNNIIYKVTYEVEGNSKVAWYRGVKTVNNIHDQSPGPYGNGFGERWIFE
ncbi:hypothetical protein ACXFAU_02030 [Paenibacillus glucanolyticus]|uniref:hypothetical protein n=1 Tax=Paenibacillus TaxID=44249 RepID=UPI00247696CC|nr:hypothetical protein [Paenibacillus sp. LBL]MDH6671359.1 hypothetical protein [Paenibacillus sp. LBL]